MKNANNIYSFFDYKNSPTQTCYIANRDLRLLDINKTLVSYGFKKITKLGDADRGEIEMLSIMNIEIDEYIKRANFFVKFHGGKIGKYIHEETDKPLIEYILKINGYYVITKKWELNVQRYMFRFISGFDSHAFFEKGYINLNKMGIPTKLIYNKVGQIVLSKMNENNTTISNITSNVVQNCGLNSIITRRKIINLTLSDDEFNNLKEILENKKFGDDEIIKVRAYLLSEDELKEKLYTNRKKGWFDDVSFSTILHCLFYEGEVVN